MKIPKISKENLELPKDFFKPTDYCYIDFRLKNLKFTFSLNEEINIEILNDPIFLEKLLELVAYAETKK